MSAFHRCLYLLYRIHMCIKTLNFRNNSVIEYPPPVEDVRLPQVRSRWLLIMRVPAMKSAKDFQGIHTVFQGIHMELSKIQPDLQLQRAVSRR